MMKIGELAARSRTKPTTIRYYERIGLLEPPRRTSSGYRAYEVDALERLVFIRRARSIGLSLAEITDVVATRQSGSAPCGQVRDLLLRHVAEIDEQVAELTALREVLNAAADRAARMDPGDCPATLVCRAVPEAVDLREQRTGAA